MFVFVLPLVMYMFYWVWDHDSTIYNGHVEF